jgi:hypothetical protein
MILRCKCGKEFMGIKSKQAIRLHIRSSHFVDVPDVMKSEFVTVVDTDKEIKKETDTTKEAVAVFDKIETKNNEYELISEVLRKGLGNAQFKEALRQAKQKGFVEINLKNLDMRG